MKLLAIDTAMERCSVALRSGGETRLLEVPSTREHAELVLPMIERVLADSGVALRDLDALAFGRGPGAFTGVRIAVGVVQGLALGLDLPVVPVSNLAAIAQQIVTRAAPVLVCSDARMGEVYWGVFEGGANGLVRALTPERVGTPVEVADLDVQPAVGVGTGFASYPALRRRFAELPVDETMLPSAREIALLGEAAFVAGAAVAARDAQPVYLRDRVVFVPPQRGQNS